MHTKWAVLGVLLYFSLFEIIEGSRGDQNVDYIECVQKCRTKLNCSKRLSTFDWVHGECFWCRYDCMWEAIEFFETNVGIIPQFHGKWPFLAIPLPFGLVIQDPASTVASLLNFVTFYMMGKRIWNIQGLQNRKMWLTYSVIGLATWLCSTVFHMADCDLTEKLDYFGAFGFILTANYCSVVFSMPDLSNFRPGRYLRTFLKYLHLFAFAHHVKVMTQDFDYGYNMGCCIVMSMLTSILYIRYLWRKKKYHGELDHSDWQLIFMLIWTNSATALDLMDFVPIFWLVDSHALFHFATIPIPIWWAQYLESMHAAQFPKNSKEQIKIA